MVSLDTSPKSIINKSLAVIILLPVAIYGLLMMYGGLQAGTLAFATGYAAGQMFVAAMVYVAARTLAGYAVDSISDYSSSVS